MKIIYIYILEVIITMTTLNFSKWTCPSKSGQNHSSLLWKISKYCIDLIANSANHLKLVCTGHMPVDLVATSRLNVEMQASLSRPEIWLCQIDLWSIMLVHLIKLM
jgi:hypothetical protein